MPLISRAVVNVIAVGLTVSLGATTSVVRAGDEVSNPALDVFPPATFHVDDADRGASRLTGQYTPSGSLWLKGLDESTVFQQELAHEQDASRSFRLRVGRGGQIYSLRGAFGESVPPSWRDGGKTSSPWNDEVWQFVAVCSKYNNQPKDGMPGTPFFIHNSGVYVEGSAKPMYCPLLANEASPDQRTYRTLNWGLIAASPSVHRAPLLYYTQVRDAGAGVVELTWVVHNFATDPDIVFDFLNAPWGGTRWTSLPYCYWSSPDGGPVDVTDTRSHANEGTRHYDQLGGWIMRTQSRDDPASPSLGLVIGRDRHASESFQTRRSIYRDYRAHPNTYALGKRPNEHRNYDVVEAIPGCAIRPGATYFFRAFFVVDRFDRAVARCNELVDHVDYGPITFDPASTPLVTATPDDKAPTFRLYARPVPNSQPLFLLESTETGQRIVTTDPYRLVSTRPFDNPLDAAHPMHDYFVKAVYHNVSDGRTRWLGMLGYGLRERPNAPGDWRQLSTVLPDRAEFPKPDEHHLDLWVRVDR
ncbi:MAG: hypothetical protein GC159_16380 [Phycisphaera sp.]|nr:hypothetical protein [Phycisphaera sp.]